MLRSSLFMGAGIVAGGLGAAVLARAAGGLAPEDLATQAGLLGAVMALALLVSVTCAAATGARRIAEIEA